MKKAELISAVAEKAGIEKKNAEKAVNAVIDTIKESLAKGEGVQLIGFGSFEVRERPERQSRNPQTGETITVPATKAPAFKAGKALKDAVK